MGALREEGVRRCPFVNSAACPFVHSSISHRVVRASTPVDMSPYLLPHPGPPGRNAVARQGRGRRMLHDEGTPLNA